MIAKRFKLPLESRDALSIQQSLIGFLASAYGLDVSEFEMALTELFAAIVDSVATLGDSLYVEAVRAAGEASIATAIEPQSVLDHAVDVYGYVPPGARAAHYTERITAPSEKTFLIRAGHRFSTDPTDGSKPQIFEAVNDAVKAAGVTTLDVEVQHGTTKSESIITSSGDAGQLYELVSPIVDTSTIQVYVDGVAWERINTWALALPTSEVFRVVASELLPNKRRYWVEFGDGLRGFIPEAGSKIEITSLNGGGTAGNVGSGTITKIVDSIVDGTGYPMVATATSIAQTVRGTDDESVDVIRVKAPMTMAIHGGVVSREDYQNAAMLFGAARARAYTRNQLSYVAPNEVAIFAAVDLSAAPTTEELEAIADDIEAAYKTNGTAKITMAPIEFYEETLSIYVYAASGLDIDELSSLYTTVINAALNFFSLDSVAGEEPHFIVDVGRTINLSNLITTLELIDGVDHVDLPDADSLFIEPGEYQLPKITANVLLLPATP